MFTSKDVVFGFTKVAVDKVKLYYLLNLLGCQLVAEYCLLGNVKDILEQSISKNKNK